VISVVRQPRKFDRRWRRYDCAVAAKGPGHDSGSVRYLRSGSGEVLLLIHGNGMSRTAWHPVLPLLETQRDVIAVDLPGHGESAPIAPHLAPAPPGFARVLSSLLDDLKIDRVHAAGNSLGGWTALELAKLGRARSVCALGPAGLWNRGPIRPMIPLASSYLSARKWPGLVGRALQVRPIRSLLLHHAFGDPERIPIADAERIVADLAAAQGFLATLLATHMGRFTGGRSLGVPVTIAFGQRDRVVPKHARRSDEVPEHTRWLELPGLGHVPMWDNPALVAHAILEAST
jgi:pimeloyl-ACP methyl ester carboxylesterase